MKDDLVCVAEDLPLDKVVVAWSVHPRPSDRHNMPTDIDRHSLLDREERR
jgi:hypothetical protein